MWKHITLHYYWIKQCIRNKKFTADFRARSDLKQFKHYERLQTTMSKVCSLLFPPF